MIDSASRAEAGARSGGLGVGAEHYDGDVGVGLAVRLLAVGIIAVLIVGGCASTVETPARTDECEVIVDFVESTVSEYSLEGHWSRSADGTVTYADLSGLPDAIVGATTVLWSNPVDGRIFSDMSAADANAGLAARAADVKLADARAQYMSHSDRLRQEIPSLTDDLEVGYLASLTLPRPLDCDWPDGVVEVDTTTIGSLWRGARPTGTQPLTFRFTNVGFSHDGNLALMGFDLGYVVGILTGSAGYVVMQRSEDGWTQAGYGRTLIIN